MPGNVETSKRFEVEYRKHKERAVGVFVLGDVNVHCIRSLTHSAPESVDERVSCNILHQVGIGDFAKELNRGKSLLAGIHRRV